MSLEDVGAAFAFAEKFENEGNIPEAIQALEMVSTFAGEIGDDAARANLLVVANMKIIKLLNNNPSRQTQYLLNLLQISSGVTDPDLLFGMAGETYKFAERLREKECISEYERWLETTEHLARRSGTPDALVLAANSLLARHAYKYEDKEMVQRIAYEYVTLAEESGDGTTLEIAAALSLRAANYTMEDGNRPTAKKYFKKAIALGELTETPEGARTTVLALATYLNAFFPLRDEDPKSYRKIAKTLIKKSKDLQTPVAFQLAAKEAINLGLHYSRSSEDSLAKRTFSLAIKLGQASKTSEGRELAARAKAEIQLLP